MYVRNTGVPKIMINDSLYGKTIFVSGADGFIGSHLVEYLVQLGARVRAMTQYNSWNEKGWLRDVMPSTLSEIEIFNGDIRDRERVSEGIHGAEYVFHLSSLISIPYSYVAPRSYVETNIVGALNVLEACRKNDSLIRLLHVSTSEVYGTAQQIPIPETHPLVGQSPYSATKIAADKLAESYFRSFNLPVVIARPFNTFGPRQTARAVIPTIVCQLLSGTKNLKLGSLTPTRDFNFVTDTTSAMVELISCERAVGETFNIGSGQEWSISATIDMLCAIIGADVSVEMEKTRVRPLNSEVNRLVADNTKIHNFTEWRTNVSFREGLKLTVDWISTNRNYFDSDRYLL
jgi:NAD dependent epimerase/dehydratase